MTTIFRNGLFTFSALLALPYFAGAGWAFGVLAAFCAVGAVGCLAVQGMERLEAVEEDDE